VPRGTAFNSQNLHCSSPASSNLKVQLKRQLTLERLHKNEPNPGFPS
jgi:hypothetical protein